MKFKLLLKTYQKPCLDVNIELQFSSGPLISFVFFSKWILFRHENTYDAKPRVETKWSARTFQLYIVQGHWPQSPSTNTFTFDLALARHSKQTIICKAYRVQMAYCDNMEVKMSELLSNPMRETLFLSF